MKLQFLGAATTVTGSQFLLTAGESNVIVDCGMFQGSPTESARNRVPLAYDASSIDALLLTHAHLDHCGLIPLLVREGFRGPIFATRATAELARIVLLDSAKLQVEQAHDRRRKEERKARREAGRGGQVPAADGSGAGHAASSEEALHERRGRGRPWAPEDWQETGHDPEEALRRQPPEVETTLFEPLYTVDDAEAAIAQFQPIDYDEVIEVADGVQATFRDAGHILGSAIIVVDASEGGGSQTRICFSGDLGRPNTPIIRDPTAIVDGADYVLVESTYGGREHEPEQEAIRLLAEAVGAVADHRGVLLIPSFAIGRTQEVVWVLDRLLEAGRIPHVPLYLDSPMATKASAVYAAFPGYYDEQTHKLLQSGETPLDYPGTTVTRTADESKQVRRAPRPMMIVASSGMLTGGRVLHHLRDIIGDPAGIVLFVGYQGEGTLGAHLQAGAKKVRIDGGWHEVRCEIRSISGFSAHADESELLDWLGHFAKASRKPKRVFLVHGDPPAEEALEPKVQALGLQTHRPTWREEVELS